jgi:hypothetical protein
MEPNCLALSSTPGRFAIGFASWNCRQKAASRCDEERLTNFVNSAAGYLKFASFLCLNSACGRPRMLCKQPVTKVDIRKVSPPVYNPARKAILTGE